MKKIISLLLIFPMCGCFRNGQDSEVSVNTTVDLQSSMIDGEKSGLFTFGNWIDEDWWCEFEDPILTNLINTAVRDNPGLNHVRMQVKQANQEAYVVRSKLFPNLNAGFAALWADPANGGLATLFPGIGEKDFHLYNLALNFSYVFDFWQQNKRLYQAALGVYNATRMQEIEAKLILSVAVAKEYYNLRSQMLKREYVDEIVGNLAKQYELINLRAINRIDNLIDINTVQMKLDRAKEALASVEGQIELERHMLNILLGRSPDHEIEVPQVWNWSKVEFSMPECVGTKLLERRPDLLASLWMVKKQALMINVATADFFPKIQLDASGGLQNIDFQDIFKDQSLMAQIMPRVTEVLFDGGRRRANLKAKIAAFESAIYTLNDALLKASKEVVDGMSSYQTIMERLSAQIDRVGSAKKNLGLVTLRYRHGIESYLAKLTSEETYLTEKLTEVEMEREQSNTYLDLIASLGGGFKPKEGDVPKGVIKKAKEENSPSHKILD